MTDTADEHSAPERMYVAVHEKCDNSAAYQNIPVGSEIDASRGQSYSWLKYTRTDVAETETAAAVERAVLAERARCGWQIIETAPKDGSLILAANIDLSAKNMTVIYWEFGSGSFGIASHWRDSTHHSVGYNEFTHWMPLPTPPDAGQT